MSDMRGLRTVAMRAVPLSTAEQSETRKLTCEVDIQEVAAYGIHALAPPMKLNKLLATYGDQE